MDARQPKSDVVGNVGVNSGDVGLALLRKFLKWGFAVGFIGVLASTPFWPLAAMIVVSAIIVEGTPIASELKTVSGWLWS